MVHTINTTTTTTTTRIQKIKKKKKRSDFILLYNAYVLASFTKQHVKNVFLKRGYRGSCVILSLLLLLFYVKRMEIRDSVRQRSRPILLFCNRLPPKLRFFRILDTFKIRISFQTDDRIFRIFHKYQKFLTIFS